MKQSFDNGGFAQVQARIINLSPSELLAETQAMRLDPTRWMLDVFDLTPSQQDDLHALDPLFRQEVADAIADAWEARQLVLFDKQEQATKNNGDDDDDDDDGKRIKDYILEHFETSTSSGRSTHSHRHGQLSFRIQYR